jgi:dTDP-4-dehydrorhamnose 3,5-epimerase
MIKCRIVSCAPEGESVQRLPEGVTFRDAVTHIDDRGTVTELFDQRWGWHKDPLVFTYAFTIRPGMIKGWCMHKEHEDRYFVLFGELEVIFYDGPPDSPTHGEVSSVVLSEYRRRLMTIPTHIWHANRNIGTRDVVALPYQAVRPRKPGQVPAAPGHRRDTL